MSRRSHGARWRTFAALAWAMLFLTGPPSRAAVVRQTPEQKIFKTDLNPRLLTYLYAPQGEARGTPVVFFSGEFGWRPLQQDTASFLASTGRLVIGLDSQVYFKDVISGPDMATDLAQFRDFANERSGRTKESPVILIGFAWGAEMVPYVLNRIGSPTARGAVLIAPDKDGANRFRVGIQLRMEAQSDERFDVEAELRRMPLIPTVLMKGTLDTQSTADVLAKAPRGPHRFVPVVGGDRQFHEVRDGFFTVLADALHWIDATLPAPSARPGAPAAAKPGASFGGTVSPTPGGTAPGTPAPAAPDPTPEATPAGH
ncbi:MAG TPA: AcvB/VirJ family lysyl-phosphatidylglycerol hydrolase [Candidatus Polarisedimenticolia bacterium]|nr:AcvB/VirJ family lysyl-phosphatidylglycerol hydrolase [Candidatus Polarisedimenticolia bacterium]